MSDNRIITPYGIAQRINAVLEGAGVDKVVPGPMMYTYAKKGYINGVKDTKRFTEAEADAFVLKYTGKWITEDVTVEQV
jgi:hypothetical protein